MFANTLLERLVVLLLRPCLPASIAANTHEGNFSRSPSEALPARLDCSQYT